MISFITIADQAFVCASLIRRVDEYAATPMPIDTQICALITPSLSTRSIITLDNGMTFCSEQPHQEIMSAIAEATQLPHDVSERFVPLSKGINIKGAYVAAILPYNAHLCDYLDECGSYIRTTCKTPRSLIVSADGNFCVASRYTPNTLLTKLAS